MKTVTVLSGSVRNERKSHYLADLIFNKLKEVESVSAILLDLKECNFPIMTDVHTDKWPDGMKEFSDNLTDSDGIIIVSPEYKNGIPGALKNTLDYLRPQSLKHIPVAIATVSSGGLGGVNCLSQLRLVTIALGGMPVSETLCVSKINELFDENGNLREKQLIDQTARFVESFLWYVNKLSQ
jgi:NAD(P)H-dependent FMN reductase